MVIESTLRKIGKLIQVDLHSALTNATWLGISSFVSAIASFLVVIALGRAVPQEVYGKYSYIVSVAALIGAFSLTGLYNTTTQAVARGHDRTVNFAREKLKKWGLLTGFLSFFVALFYFKTGDTELALGFAIAGVFSPFIASHSIFSSLLSGKKKFRKLSLITIVNAFVVSATLVFVIYNTNNLVLIVGTFFITSFLSVLFADLFSKNEIVTGTAEATNLGYAKHLSLMNAFAIISSNIDKVLVFNLLGPAQLAVYSLATVPVKKLRIFDSVLSNVALPSFSQRTLTELKKTVPIKVLVLSLFLGAISILYILIAPVLFSVLFPAYIDSIKYSQVFSIILVFMSGVLFTQALTAHERKKELYTVKTSIPVLRIVLFLVLIPTYEIWGVIYALIVSQIVNFILLWYLLRKSNE